MINIDDFAKVELRVGTILEAEAIPGSEKLIKFQIDVGEEKPRQILSGIKKWYKPKDLIGKQIIVVANLEPRMMMGLESQGMICAVGEDPSTSLRASKPILLKPFKKVSNGTKVR